MMIAKHKTLIGNIQNWHHQQQQQQQQQQQSSPEPIQNSRLATSRDLAERFVIGDDSVRAQIAGPEPAYYSALGLPPVPNFEALTEIKLDPPGRSWGL